MALIRGPNGLAPCPVCLVPKNEQQYLKLPSGHPPRDWRAVQAIVKSNMSATKKEALLQPHGWRAVEVFVFMCLARLLRFTGFVRMCSGESRGATSIAHSRSTAFTSITVECGAIISLPNGKTFSVKLRETCVAW